ncbi:methyltransferase [candidate division KSB1 bacterium]|nr:methyltransferase [candidate division KSB1 bacterium]
MNSRERLLKTLNHQPADRVCIDFGATGQTGIGVSAVYQLRKKLLNDSSTRVKVIEPYQMLGEVDELLRHALNVDVMGVFPPKNMFGFENTNWKPFEMFDGTPLLVPEDFNYTSDENNNILIYPEGDVTVPACAMMPDGGYFFDALKRQEPLDENNLNPEDNCREFGLISQDDLDYFAASANKLYSEMELGIVMTIPGTAFGDIALVPATWMKAPKGIRDVEEWYISILTRRDYVYEVFEKQCEIVLENIRRLAKAVGDKVQLVHVSGTDFGTQSGLFISPDVYRDLFKPFQKKVNDLIHELTDWKIFIHSCGAVSELIPDFIEAGFDIFNPVQCSATGMEPRRLKAEFGKDIVFWGGGGDTQKTLPFGTPEDVYREVRERIEIFSDSGGFVFNTIHNIQSNVPVENILSMLQALKDSI